MTKFTAMSFTLITLEPTAYLDALMFQENFFNAQLEKKAKGEKTTNTLILLEHKPVYTLGKSGNLDNLKIPIEETDAEFYRTKRGGDITFHGLGQLVIYPVFDYDKYNLSTRNYIHNLEQCVIDCLADYNIKSGRIESASGVWIDGENDKARKICAIGLKVSRHVSMHGLALNINTDLTYFENITPCGIADKSVTSMQKELGKEVNFFEVQMKILQKFEEKFA